MLAGLSYGFSCCLFQRGAIRLAWCHGVLGTGGGTGSRISRVPVVRASVQPPGPAVETSGKGFTQYNKTRWEAGLSLVRVSTLAWAVLVFSVYLSIFQTCFYSSLVSQVLCQLCPGTKLPHSPGVHSAPLL